MQEARKVALRRATCLPDGLCASPQGPEGQAHESQRAGDQRTPQTGTGLEPRDQIGNGELTRNASTDGRTNMG